MHSELYQDDIRRELRDIDAAQRSAMPRFRDALRRVFQSGDYDERAKADVALGGLSRRSVLRIGGLTVVGGVLLAACGSDDDSSSGITSAPGTTGPGTTAAGNMTGDVAILRTASSIEELAVAAYQTAIDSGLVTTAAIADAAMLFQAHHREHSGLFQAATEEAGGEAFAEPNPAILEMIQPAIDALQDERGIVALAFDLETVAAQTYQSNVGTFSDPNLNVAIMSVGGVEARHAAVLAGVLGQPQVPVGFQVTDKAVAAGTGV
jgi:Ferritin-like domain